MAHLSPDGLVVGYGLALPANVGFDGYVGHVATLSDPCLEGLHRRVGLESGEPQITALFEQRPSLSADGGSAVTSSVHDESLINVRRYDIHCWDGNAPDEPPLLLDSLSISQYLDQGPRPHVASDGSTVWYQEPILNALPKLHRSALDGSGQCETDNGSGIGLVLARTQSATSSDGSVVVGRKAPPVSSMFAHGAWRFVFGSGGCTPSSTLAIAGRTLSTSLDVFSDVTVSADGKRAAFASQLDLCGGGTLGEWDVYVWDLDADASSDFPWSSSTCDATSTNAGGDAGWLARIVPASPHTGHEDLSPVLSADGRRVFFISTADYTGNNGANLPTLFKVDIGSLASPSTTQVFAQVSEEEASLVVLHASVSATGESVVYWRTDVSDNELRFVNVDHGSPSPSSDTGTRVPHLPFEVDITDCSPTSGARSITARLRQFQGGDRRLLLRFGVEDTSGDTTFAPLRVQPLADGEMVDVTVEVPQGDSEGTCRVSAIDMAQAQGDAASDSLAFSD